MSLYDTPDGAERYAQMAEDYDQPEHVERLAALLPAGAAVLELGIGPGRDFDRLRQRFVALGTDTSLAFLERYQDRHPKADLIQLDAATLRTERTFDGIFSNKVLQHLTREQMQASLFRQAELLLPGGVAVHTLWYGACAPDEHDGLPVTYYTPETLAALLPDGLELEEAVRYTEMEPDDSLRVVLRKPRQARQLRVTGSVQLA